MTRFLFGLATATLAGAVISCADVSTRGVDPRGSQSQTPPAPKPGQTTLGGSVAGNEPTPSPKPSGSATPTPTIASPSPAATAPHGALGLSISPTTVMLSVPPGEGDGPSAGMAHSAQLAAFVMMADGSTSSTAVWRSLSPEIATVSASGLVTVLGPGGGTGPWSVGIEATSQDGFASEVRIVTVRAVGEVGVSIE